MPEKFDFSKISAEGGSAFGGEDKKEFASGGENLPQEEKDKTVGEAQEEIKEIIEDKLIEKEQGEQKRILEIGVGGAPFFAARKPPTRKLEDKEMYIGLDVKEEELKIAKNNYAQEKVSFIKGSAEDIPLKDKSVDEVIMREVLDAPVDYFRYKMRPLNKQQILEMVSNFHSWDFEEPSDYHDHQKMIEYVKEYIEPEKIPYDNLSQDEQNAVDSYYEILEKARVAQETKINFINETKRVMKREGKFVLVNISTPEISKPFIKYLEADRFFERIQLDADEIKNWQDTKGLDVFRVSKEIKEFETELEQFFTHKKEGISSTLIDFTLNAYKEEKIPPYLFRITNEMMSTRTKSSEEKELRTSASRSLLYSAFYLEYRFLRKLKASRESFSWSDYKLYSPILYIVDSERLFEDENIEVEEGLEKPNEVKIKGNFTPYSLCVDSADKFMITLQFFNDLLPKDKREKLKRVFEPYVKQWREIELLRNRRIPK